MRKRIDNRMYDTETAKKILSDCYFYNRGKGRYKHSVLGDLYLKRTGEFFFCVSVGEGSGWGCECQSHDGYKYIYNDIYFEEVKKGIDFEKPYCIYDFQFEQYKETRERFKRFIKEYEKKAKNYISRK